MAAGDFCSLSDLKLWLGIAVGTTTDDAILTSLITNATAGMLNRMNRAGLLSASYSETRSGNGSTHLVLKNFPVTAVASLTINGITINPSPDGVQAGYVFDQYQISLIGYCFSWPGGCAGSSFYIGDGNVVVNYTAGYPSIPLDVSEACKEWCAFRYRQRSYIGQTSKHLATGETISFSQKDLPAEVAAVIEQYTRRIPV